MDTVKLYDIGNLLSSLKCIYLIVLSFEVHIQEVKVADCNDFSTQRGAVGKLVM